MMANIESVWASGKNRYFWREAPSPRPKNPPEDKEKNTQKIKDFITQIRARLTELEKAASEKKRPKEEHIKVKKKIGKKQIKYSKPKPKKKKK